MIKLHIHNIPLALLNPIPQNFSLISNWLPTFQFWSHDETKKYFRSFIVVAKKARFNKNLMKTYSLHTKSGSAK